MQLTQCLAEGRSQYLVKRYKWGSEREEQLESGMAVWGVDGMETGALQDSVG